MSHSLPRVPRGRIARFKKAVGVKMEGWWGRLTREHGREEEGGIPGQGSQRGSRLWYGDIRCHTGKAMEGTPALFSRVVGWKRAQYRRVPSIQTEKSPCRIQIDERDP